MYYKLTDLFGKTDAEFVRAFTTLPAGVTMLDLGQNFLGSKAGADLARAFAAIPEGCDYA